MSEIENLMAMLKPAPPKPLRWWHTAVPFIALTVLGAMAYGMIALFPSAYADWYEKHIEPRIEEQLYR